MDFHHTFFREILVFSAISSYKCWILTIARLVYSRVRYLNLGLWRFQRAAPCTDSTVDSVTTTNTMIQPFGIDGNQPVALRGLMGTGRSIREAPTFYGTSPTIYGKLTVVCEYQLSCFHYFPSWRQNYSLLLTAVYIPSLLSPGSHLSVNCTNQGAWSSCSAWNRASGDLRTTWAHKRSWTHHCKGTTRTQELTMFHDGLWWLIIFYDGWCWLWCLMMVDDGYNDGSWWLWL